MAWSHPKFPPPRGGSARQKGGTVSHLPPDHPPYQPQPRDGPAGRPEGKPAIPQGALEPHNGANASKKEGPTLSSRRRLPRPGATVECC
jgi:hypothetical protein